MEAKDVLDREIVAGDIIISHMPSVDNHIVSGWVYKVNSIVGRGEIEILNGNDRVKAYGRHFIKIMGGLDTVTCDLDDIAVRIQLLINSKPRSPLKEEIISALRGAS